MATNKSQLITSTVLITLTVFGLTNARNCVNSIGESQSTTLDFIEEITSGIQSVVRILKGYQSSVGENSEKMCNLDKPLAINTADENNGRTLIPVIPTIPSPPDVTNHINIQLLPSIVECGLLSTRSRINHGYQTDLYEFPWMVLLSYQTRNGRSFLCAGTLINERYVLTAAHCITNLDNHTRLQNVRLGMEGKNPSIYADLVQDILIEEVIPHPNYNSKTFSNDIGLLRLSSPAQLKENVQPICLPVDETLRNKDFTNATLVGTGWGATKTFRRSNNLLKVEISIVPEEECKIAYNKTQVLIDYKQLCGDSRNTKASCRGDSGGPLQLLETIDDDVHFVQNGIVSFGRQYCEQIGYPIVYTRNYTIASLHTEIFASSESTLEDLKNVVLQHEKCSARLDVFLSTHIESIVGSRNPIGSLFKKINLINNDEESLVNESNLEELHGQADKYSQGHIPKIFPINMFLA